jgi:hypothetical protein
MIKYKNKTFRRQVANSYVCDRCKKEVSVDDIMELQEWHRVSFVGGYSSVFGDGCKVEADICQNCLLELIGAFCRRTEEECV